MFWGLHLLERANLSNMPSELTWNSLHATCRSQKHNMSLMTLGAPRRFFPTEVDALQMSSTEPQAHGQHQHKHKQNTSKDAHVCESTDRRNQQNQRACAWQLFPHCTRSTQTSHAQTPLLLPNLTQRAGSSCRLGRHHQCRQQPSRSAIQRTITQVFVPHHRARLRFPLPRRTHVGNMQTFQPKHHSMLGHGYWSFCFPVRAAMVLTRCPQRQVW